MAVELTDEIRQAVLDEECTRLGHDFDVSTAITGDGNTDGPPRMTVGSSRNPDHGPHLRCLRCHRAWILVEVPAVSYLAAEADLIGRLRDGDELRARLVQRRDRRNQPAPAPAPDLSPRRPR